MNVLINTQSMKDRTYAEEMNARVGFLLYSGRETADAVIEKVRVQLI